MEKNLKKNIYMRVCVCVNHFAVHLKYNTVYQLHFNLKKERKTFLKTKTTTKKAWG